MHVREDDSKAMLGLYWCNSADTFVDILNVQGQKKAHWMSETGHL